MGDIGAGHSVFDPKNGRGVFAFLWPNQGTCRPIIGAYRLALTHGFQWYQKDVCRCFSLVTMKHAPHKYYTGSLIVNWYTVQSCCSIVFISTPLFIILGTLSLFISMFRFGLACGLFPTTILPQI